MDLFEEITAAVNTSIPEAIYLREIATKINEMDINRTAAVQTVQQISINASPEKIWKIMSRIDLWDKWHSDIKKPILDGPFQEGSRFDWKSGGLNIRSTLHTVTPYSKIGWSGRAFGTFAIHNWTFTQMQGYTEVLVEESMDGHW